MKKFFLVLIFISILIYLVFLTGRPSQPAGFFEVKSGQSLAEISENLKTQRILNSKYLFFFYVLIKGKEKELQPGFYLFSSTDNFVDIAEKIIEGKSYKIKITFPEGFNLKEIENRLMKEKILTEKDLAKLKITEFKNEFLFLDLAPSALSLEGFLFPDTYFFDPQMAKIEIAKLFLNNFDKKLTQDLREEIKAQGKSIFEIVIMASLLEKEVKTKEDRKLVSGILWKRLKAGLPLQVDATITYITGKKTTKISKEETQIDSPYNTYKYLGLPLGPICNPGLESILAALYPKSSEYWYYLSMPEGETFFSETLKEHNIAKAKYLE